MKKYEGECFDTIAVNGNHRLILNHNETFYDVVNCINESNKRATRKGYKAEQWIITQVRWCSIYDDEGNFVRSERTQQAVTEYPVLLNEEGE